MYIKVYVLTLFYSYIYSEKNKWHMIECSTTPALPTVDLRQEISWGGLQVQECWD